MLLGPSGLTGWKGRYGMLSEANAIRARPVHGKGTSHLNRKPDEA